MNKKIFKKMSVSIGIPAYNEEANIKNLLLSVLSQKQEGFFIKEIIVVSDGSTDNTVSQVKSTKNSKIFIVDHKDRKGQPIRQNEILSMATGDLIAFFEADTLIKGNYYLKQLTSAFLTNKNLHIAFGKTVSINGNNLFERIIVFAEKQKLRMFNQLNKGYSLYTFHYGKIINRKLFKKFKWQPDVPEDAYLYIYGNLNGLNFYYDKKAIIYYRNPGNIFDYLKKTIRFNKGKEKLRKYFSQQTIIRFYKIPRDCHLKLIISFFCESPTYTFAYSVFLIISKMVYIFSPKYSQLWQISRTTKRLELILFKHENI